jgi:hypothetical protein
MGRGDDHIGIRPLAELRHQAQDDVIAPGTVDLRGHENVAPRRLRSHAEGVAPAAINGITQYSQAWAFLFELSCDGQGVISRPVVHDDKFPLVG